MRYLGKNVVSILLWFVEGMLVGFGAILPGISGGTLCVAFGMYRPIIETLSNPLLGLKKYGYRMTVFFLGGVFGFVGLSGVAALLLAKNSDLVTCAFIGFIIGTIPELWKEAGNKGRNITACLTLLIAFMGMVLILSIMKSNLSVTIEPGLAGYLFCGLLWGLSFIVPGLSSSSLLLLFGLYQPMLEGIASIDFSVLIPIGIGVAACVLLLSRGMEAAYQYHYATVSHMILGIVAATAIMVFPEKVESIKAMIWDLLLILGGIFISLAFSKFCSKVKQTD